MKTSLLIVSVLSLLVACGQEQKNTVPDISMTSVIWQGYPQDNPGLEKRLQETKDCLASFGLPAREDSPYVIVVSDTFICGAEQTAGGCFAAELDTIFFTENVNVSTIDPFKHEVIHWDTGFDDRLASQPFFLKCEEPSQAP